MNRVVLAVLTLYAGASVAFGQQPRPHPGLVLCQEGKYAESILPLENATKDNFLKDDAKVWNCLAIAYLKRNDLKRAQKSGEKAAKLNPNSSAFHSNLAYIYLLQWKNSKGRGTATKAIAADPTNAQAYYFRGTANLRELKFDDAEVDARKILGLDATFQQAYMLLSEVFMGRLSKRLEAGSTMKAELPLLRSAVDALVAGKEKCKGQADCTAINEEFESISAFHRYFADKEAEPIAEPAVPDPDITPLKLLSKPRPGYTDEARQANITGTVRIAVLFGVDGKVWHTLVLNHLGGGLDRQAVAAARRITFEPMKRNGKPVPVVRMVEYSFDIY